jgi:hypothetical protein
VDAQIINTESYPHTDENFSAEQAVLDGNGDPVLCNELRASGQAEVLSD